MHRKVAVAKLKPGLAAEFAQRAHELPGFLRSTPAALWVGQTAERIEYRVEIGRDLETEVLEVIAGIYDDGQFRTEHAEEAQRELGAADAAT
jgi:hypothetical protein